jgi:glycosyltransferase involved in cell wall biosynthesis
MLQEHRPLVSVVIKALNEERHIAATIESALAALADIDGEIILADSKSTDATLDIARRYPITIVQMSNLHDRSCGAGAQLGFQYSRGHYVYLIDGDMKLRPGFLSAAIRHLESNPLVAGVGGIIVESDAGNQEFAQRAARDEPDRRPGRVMRLDCGGLFRRSAIESVGYFTDRNLHGGEELELGARLRARGWLLERIAVTAIDHRGHSGSSYRMLLRRITSRIAFGTGETVRAALGQPHFPLIFDNNNTLKLCLLVHGWWISLAGSLLFIPDALTAALAAAGLVAFPIVAMAVRWRSLAGGLYSVAAWNVYALCFLPGLLRRRAPPAAWIESTIVQAASAPAAPEPRMTAAR